MKQYTIIALTLLVFLMVGCVGGSEETPENYGEVFGTVFLHKNMENVNADVYYVVNDTTVGMAEMRFYIKNGLGLNFEDNTRIIMVFNNLGAINDTSFWVDYTDYFIVPTRIIETVNDEMRDTLSKDIVSFKISSISHDFLNLEFLYNYSDLGKHYFYVTEDLLKRPENDTVLLNFHHRDHEKLPNYYKTYRSFISVPISDLKNIYPEKDSIFIQVIAEQEGMSDVVLPPIIFRYGNFSTEEEETEE